MLWCEVIKVVNLILLDLRVCIGYILSYLRLYYLICNVLFVIESEIFMFSLDGRVVGYW